MNMTIIDKNKVDLDMDGIISKKRDHFIPLNYRADCYDSSLFLFLSEKNFNTFKQILNNNHSIPLEQNTLKNFISNSCDEYQSPIISDSCLDNIFRTVTKDKHLMKNLIFAITMQNLFNN